MVDTGLRSERTAWGGKNWKYTFWFYSPWCVLVCAHNCAKAQVAFFYKCAVSARIRVDTKKRISNAHGNIRISEKRKHIRFRFYNIAGLETSPNAS